MRKTDVTIGMTLNFVESITNKLTINFGALALIRDITARSHLPSPKQLQLIHMTVTHGGGEVVGKAPHLHLIVVFLDIWYFTHLKRV